MKTLVIVIIAAALTAAGMIFYLNMVIAAKEAEITEQAAFIEALVDAPPDTVPGDTVWLKEEPATVDTGAIEAGLRGRLLAELPDAAPDTVYLEGDTVLVPAEPVLAPDSMTYAELDTSTSFCRIWARLWLESLLWEVKIDEYFIPPVIKTVDKPLYPKLKFTAGSYYGGAGNFGSRAGLQIKQFGLDFYITDRGPAGGLSYSVRLK